MVYLKIILFLGMILSCYPTYSKVSAQTAQSTAVVKSKEEFLKIPAIETSAKDYLKTAQKIKGMTRFIFVRHGESNSNAEGSIAGRTIDTDLSDKGIGQAQDTGKQLKASNLTIDKVYSSPTLRTQKTAFNILVNMGYSTKIVQDNRLHEKWYGPYEGATKEQYAPIKIQEEEEIALLPNFEEKFIYRVIPEMESMQDVHARASAFIKEASVYYSGENVLVATHNGVMKALFMADSAQRGFDVEYRSYDLGNCAILVLEIDENDQMQIVATSGLKFKNKK